MKESLELLRSAYQIAVRKGVHTNWEAFANCLQNVLAGDTRDEPRIARATCTARTFRIVDAELLGFESKTWGLQDYLQMYHAGNKSAMARAFGRGRQGITTMFKDPTNWVVIQHDRYRYIVKVHAHQRVIYL